MTKEEIDRMDMARHLLPAPGDEVVGQLISEIRNLKVQSQAFLDKWNSAEKELHSTRDELYSIKENLKKENK